LSNKSSFERFLIEYANFLNQIDVGTNHLKVIKQNQAITLIILLGFIIILSKEKQTFVPRIYFFRTEKNERIIIFL
jgi:hypothetical protein